ncbi:hypothetical protein LOC68_04490 [Blastopirellula sp. JC732]|uniref:Uncharacterized protein n=1 Tax=Blastopirellula sediminis TaxID=2894196 RepID=A0A9X1SFL1_9BACT|nr:hypothetical protein [Blastopirellula sediminis]MCC9609583.1 hypothetical protein [Blastopirellula sediminis]MCC9627641.1 hypothetical protein [Blastopirellula sediminis]
MLKNWLGCGCIAVSILFFLLIGALWVLFSPGIRVTVQNVGTTPMQDVVLHVTGNDYPLGDLPPGATARARVNSTGESGLEIEYVDPNGDLQRLNAGGYFEPGYRGTIRVKIEDGVIVENLKNL